MPVAGRVPWLVLALAAAAAWGPRASEAAEPGTPPRSGPAFTIPKLDDAPSKTPGAPNKGRLGLYHVETSNPKYSYYVCVPKTYSEKNPAGLHVFFHGESGANTAPAFDLWSKHFLEPFNLIGINLAFDVPGEEEFSDSVGRAALAAEAIRRTAADYKIVAGRGVIASFANGGLVHEQLFAKMGRAIPFNHVSLYSSFHTQPPPLVPPMSWFMSVGTTSWTMRQCNVGPAQLRKAAILMANAQRGGCADIYLKIRKGGHAMPDDDVRDAAEQFRRSDIAFAPFIYEGDFADRQLLKIAQNANRREFAKAALACDAIASGGKADKALAAGAAEIKTRIDARIDAMVALVKELALPDAVLCANYGAVFDKQLTGHPRKAELDAALAEAKKAPGAKDAVAAFQLFAGGVGTFFRGNELNPDALPILVGAAKKTPDTALLGRMARGYLELKDGM